MLGERSRGLVAGEAEQDGGGAVREFGGKSGEPQQAQYAVEFCRVSVADD